MKCQLNININMTFGVVVKNFIVFASIIYLFHPYAIYAAESNYISSIEEVDTEEIKEHEEGKWTGIDVSIVGKYAEKYGRPPRDPYINTDQGDLLLFVFTFFGLVGGVIIGYNFRKLFIEGKDNNNSGI